MASLDSFQAHAPNLQCQSDEEVMAEMLAGGQSLPSSSRTRSLVRAARAGCEHSRRFRIAVLAAACLMGAFVFVLLSGLGQRARESWASRSAESALGLSLAGQPHYFDSHVPSGDFNVKLPGRIPTATPPPRPLELMPWAAARQKAERVVADLSYEECVSLLAGSRFSNTPTPGYYTGNTKAIPRLTIPALKMQDASSGFRPSQPGENATVTEFPSLLALAASWDPTLVSKTAAAIADEFRGKGANAILGPGVNVNRVTKGGRNFDLISGDDPYLGSVLASAYIKAVQERNVMAVVKHYAFNEQETHRNYLSAKVDERTKWELYYQPFQAAVSAGAGAVMCSYNRFNGVYACDSQELLKDDLKSKMGFQGFVVSDWGEMPYAKFFAPERLKEMKNVSNHSTSKHTSRKLLVTQLQKASPSNKNATTGLRPTERSLAVKESATRILTSMYRLRLDAHAGCEPPCLSERLTNQRSKEHVQLAREAAAQSVVLLKNDGLLPLSPRRVSSIAIFGMAANASDTKKIPKPGDWPWPGTPYSGGGSSHITTGDGQVMTPLDAIRKRAKEHNISVKFHTENNDVGKAMKLAKEVEVVIIVAATTSMEGQDRASLDLDDGASELIWAISNFKPTVLLMQIPGAVLMPWRHRPAAMLSMFLGGEQTGNAWADVLFGDIVPSGKLPVAIPATQADTIPPAWGSWVSYSESLWTSYRSDKLKFPLSFGHGLSYTIFTYGALEVEERSQGASLPAWALARVRLSIVNSGSFHGAEVVQAYVSFPLKAQMPDLVLRNFQKTSLLAPGQLQAISFYFSRRDLSKYVPGAGWVTQCDVKVKIGSSSRDIRQTVILNSCSSPSTTKIPEPTSTASPSNNSVHIVARPWLKPEKDLPKKDIDVGGKQEEQEAERLEKLLRHWLKKGHKAKAKAKAS